MIKPVATILLYHIKTTFFDEGEIKEGSGSDMGQKKLRGAYIGTFASVVHDFIIFLDLKNSIYYN